VVRDCVKALSMPDWPPVGRSSVALLDPSGTSRPFRQRRDYVRLQCNIRRAATGAGPGKMTLSIVAGCYFRARLSRQRRGPTVSRIRSTAVAIGGCPWTLRIGATC
jgi:hypothetical protein